MAVRECFRFITLLIVLPLVLNTALADQAETPDGRSWLAEDINGKGVMDMLQSTIEFAEDGKVAGNGGCNRYFGSVKISGHGIKFGPLGATRKMCPESIMNQEMSFMQALGTVNRWDMNNGLLYLYADSDEAVLRFSEIEQK